jgi:hypothetical protein
LFHNLRQTGLTCFAKYLGARRIEAPDGIGGAKAMLEYCLIELRIEMFEHGNALSVISCPAAG